MAQALEVARRTVADLPDGDQRRVHSLHAYFLRPVDVTAPSRWTVERTRDGRGFSARRVVGEQGGKAVLMAMASFHVPVQGDDELRHDPPTAGPGAIGPLPGADDPDALPSTADRLVGTAPGRDTDYWAHGRSVDLRHAEDAVYTSAAGEQVARQVVWVRTLERLPDDPALHRTVLAYLCDYTALEPALRRHGLAWADPGLVTASVDHACGGTTTAAPTSGWPSCRTRPSRAAARRWGGSASSPGTAVCWPPPSRRASSGSTPGH
ncbi:MAG: thioesterase family protein [Quadrisphaera sp.]